jgi:hypothetical protein
MATAAADAEHLSLRAAHRGGVWLRVSAGHQQVWQQQLQMQSISLSERLTEAESGSESQLDIDRYSFYVQLMRPVAANAEHLSLSLAQYKESTPR